MTNVFKPTRAYIVRVTFDDASVPGGRGKTLYAALTGSEAEALESVRSVRPSTDELLVLPDRLSPETTAVLGLAVGQASPL